MTDHAKGLLIGVGGILVLTPDSLIIRMIHGNAWTVTFWRGVLVGGVLLGFFAIRERGNFWRMLRAMGWYGVAMTLLYALGSWSFNLAIKSTVVANVLLIISSLPLLAALLSLLVLRESVPLRTWLAIAIAGTGIAVIVAEGIAGGSWFGEFFAFLTALTLAVQFVLIRKAKAINFVPTIGLGGLLAAAVMLFVTNPFEVPVSDYWLLALMGLVIQPISFAAINLAPRYLPAPEVGLIMLLETVLGPIWVWIFLNEVPSRMTVVGGGFVLGALIFNAILSLRTPPSSATSSLTSSASIENTHEN
ncbi:MAG: DMT family transporter [Verrucomicrobiota bacterium]|nr:DMT family transporter [Verrucomicrobiota bacterium]